MYKETSAIIYHHGEHTCTAVKPRELVADKVKGYFKENPKVTPSQLATMKIANAIKSGEDWQKIKEDAKPLLDKNGSQILSKVPSLKMELIIKIAWSQSLNS